MRHPYVSRLLTGVNDFLFLPGCGRGSKITFEKGLFRPGVPVRRLEDVMNGKILIVDDQKGVRKLLEELFKKDGWEVFTATDGREAVAKADETLPNIILMDVKMPNMNGLEASMLILAKHSQIPIMMMTAYGEIETVKSAMDAGVKKCISKPFDIMVLKEMVYELAAH